jgi:hypothetical protein
MNRGQSPRERNHTMKTITRFGWICLLPLLAIGSANAAATAQLDVLKPFLDPHAVAIIELNVHELDVAAASDGLIEALPESHKLWSAPIEQARAALEPWHREFRQAGGQRVYIVASLAWLGYGPPVAVIAPLTRDADPDRLKAALAMMTPHWQPRVLHGSVVSGPDNVLLKLQAGGAAPTTLVQWQAAFAAAPAGVARLVLVPYAESERVIEDVLPTLPRMLGGGPGTILSRGFRWGTASLRLPPRGGLSLVIQSESADAALALHRVMEHGLSVVGELPDVRRDIPGWTEIEKLILPVVVGDRLERELDLAQVVHLAQALQPSMDEARTKAQRVATINRLKQIGLALRVYAHEHGDRLPPHLADTLQHLGDPRILLHPGDVRVPPADLVAQSRDAQVRWIDEHSPFVYVRPGVLLKEVGSPGSTVAVHERFEPGQDEPVGVLFVDGSVQMMSPDRLRQLLDEAAQ